ncbi:tRNA adenosine(34) deaminase TadA [Marinospirillum insulare]|uniref:tRNA-specific adenosine deaminase n=1 Tax=Marinospirillum insulare TaxID=217169 RepID=A0ABQ5ZTN7_9GAMM|nr:tRNA adenosine(34) deaminase TadA [Marinospirillum insulare]GLR63520.1 tRNA-specific adenosine deaminase [Marinospirillum insulare]
MAHKPEYYMHRALELAAEAAALSEVPVGAVIVNAEGEIIGRGFNQCISQQDATAHAEVQAIRDACQNTSNYRLNNCTLYVTLEPCTMCIGAILNARIKTLYYGAKEPRTGAIASVCNLPAQPWFNHQLEVKGGLLQAAAKKHLEDFFKPKR